MLEARRFNSAFGNMILMMSKISRDSVNHVASCAVDTASKVFVINGLRLYNKKTEWSQMSGRFLLYENADAHALKKHRFD